MMSFLGNGEYREALRVLEQIILDGTDPDRNVALLAVFQIDNEIGEKYATHYRSDSGRLGAASNDILMGKPYLYKRTTYLESLTNYLERKYL